MDDILAQAQTVREHARAGNLPLFHCIVVFWSANDFSKGYGAIHGLQDQAVIHKAMAVQQILLEINPIGRIVWLTPFSSKHLHNYYHTT